MNSHCTFNQTLRLESGNILIGHAPLGTHVPEPA
jgi:hypothetical protein